MRSIIYVADHCVSPVKLDRQSSIGVATVIGEIANVNNDIAMIRFTWCRGRLSRHPLLRRNGHDGEGIW